MSERNNINSCRIYTPSPLAAAMTRALGHECGARWLEPSFGRGVFVNEIAALGVERSQLVGVDLDRRKSKYDGKCVAIRGRDFLFWSSRQLKKFDRIIGNPPFIAIEKLRDPVRTRASQTRWHPLESFGLNGNLWASFLISSLGVLKECGHLSFVLPAAWGYADYASDLRKKLPGLFREFVCHRSKEPLFPSVQDGCYVIQCFGFREKNRITSSHIYETADDLIKGLRPPVRPSAPNIRVRAQAPTDETCRAGDLFQVRLGAVTGDASYFLLSESRRRELDLPLSCLAPVVTRARHLTAPYIQRSQWTKIRDSGDRAYLFRPTERCLDNNAVKSYLRLSRKKGGCNRTAGWVRKREPWYAVTLPEQFDAFMSGTNSNGPCIALNAMHDLMATNTLYVIRFAEQLQDRDAKAACALSLLTTFSRAQLANRTRTYAAGMRKLEPSDITGVFLPVKSNVRNAYEIYQIAAQTFIGGDPKTAIEIADDWFATRH